MLDTIQIGKKLAELRIKKIFTQEELAELLDVSHQAVSKWERGLAVPSIDNLCFLMDLYAVSLEELLCLNSREGISDIDTLFCEHDRSFIIHEVVLGKIQGFLLKDILHRLSEEERKYALYLMVEQSLSVDVELWPRLSSDERYYLIHQHNELKYPLDIPSLLPLMSQNEIKKCKGEKYEYHKNVTFFRNKRTKRIG